MKKSFKNILILILVLAIALSLIVALASCKPKDDGRNNLGPDDDVLSKYDKVAILKNIKDGLQAQISDIKSQSAGIREVKQEFIFRASGVNLMLYYDAKIDIERKEDSEIMFKVDNLSENTNALFVFYHNKDLYVYIGKNIFDIEELSYSDINHTQKFVVENFSTHRFFPTFINLVENLDLKDFIYSDLISSRLGAMYDSVETKNIIQTPLDGHGTVSTIITNIDLDKYKQVVNGYVENKIAPIGNKIDVLTRALLGFKFSNLSSFQVSRLTLKELETIERVIPGKEGKFVDSINIIFSDKQSDNITDYEVGFRYITKSYTRNEFKYFTDNEIGPLSPFKISYKVGGEGSVHLVGKMIVPGTQSDIGEEWDIEVKGNISAVDDSEHSKNKLMVSIRDKSVIEEGEFSYDNVILEAWLKNGTAYIDAQGLLDKFIGSSIDYQKIGFPKAYIEDINLSTLISAMYSRLFEGSLQDFNLMSLFNSLTSEEEEPSTTYKDYLDFVESKGDVFTITINKDFIETVVGENETLASIVGKKLNLSAELISALEKVDLFDNLSAKISYDFSKRRITVSLYNKTKLFLTMYLDVQETESEFEVIYPDVDNPSYFELFEKLQEPPIKNANVDIILSHQKRNGLDISKFVGLFAGDISGRNTPMVLSVNEGLSIKGNVWEDNQLPYVHLSLYKVNHSLTTNDPALKEQILFEIATNKENTDELLVYDAIHNLRFKMSRFVFVEIYNELTGSNIIFNYEEIVKIISKADEYGQVLLRGDDIFVDIKPKIGEDNILKKYVGTDGLYSQMKLKVNFEVPSSYASVESSLYQNVILGFNEDIVYVENIYQLKFADKLNVTLDGNSYVFNASYKDDSVKFVEGKDSYNPLARLFGQSKSYNIRITDRLSGHKKVQRLQSGYLDINPSLETPVPSKIPVVYQDGTIGQIDYRIINFPYNNENIDSVINGEEYKAYKVVIGEGSVNEIWFNLEVKIISCAIKTISGVYAYDTPVVASISIDPVEYALQVSRLGKYHKENNPNGYNPIIYRSTTIDGYGKNDLVIEFWHDINNPNKGTRKELVSDPMWDFNFDDINYEGFTKVVLGKYNRIDIAMEITVESKSVSHIKINDDPNSYYTVDALIKSTHTIPSISSFQNEVRVYFNSGHYRIVGDGEPIDDPDFDGYYNRPLVWSYSTADFAQVDGTRMPLARGTQNKTQATFGLPSIGTQILTLNVVCPTRIPKYVSDTTVSIVRIEYNEDFGTINEAATVREAIKTHLLAFNENDAMGTPFSFDPYSLDATNLNLPTHIYMDALYAGSITKKTRYSVTWSAVRPGENPTEARNIIEPSGKIKNALAAESYLEVNGVIGDNLKTNIRLLIYNKSASYDRVIFYNADEELYTYNNDQGKDKSPVEFTNEFGKSSYSLEHINAYNSLVLPQKARLIFPVGTELEDNIYPVVWESDEGLTLEEYINTKLTPLGGQVEFRGLIGGGDIVSQVIPLVLKFSKKIVVEGDIFSIVSTLTPESSSSSGSGDRYEVVNTYSQESKDILEKFILSPNHIVGVRFDDESIALEVDGTFANANQFIELLQSPYGSDARFNTLYPNGLFTLIGTIKKGTSLEQNISLRLRIDAQIIAGMNFARIDSTYRAIEAGISAIKIEQTHQIYTEGALNGNNSLTLTINKPFMLKRRVGDSLQTVSLQDYLSFIFERISISLGSRSIEAKAHVEFINNFNDIAYHKDFFAGENVSYEEDGEVVVITLGLAKFGEGSCKEPYELKIKVRKDSISQVSATEQIEVFDTNGVPIYGSSYGYTIPQSYSINFASSGAVDFQDLQWRSYRDVPLANIEKDAVVTNIINKFFNFGQNNTIQLYTTLPNGERFIRNLNFLGKVIVNVNYDIEDSGKFNIKTLTYNDINAGTLKIFDIYNFFPIEEIPSQLPTRIKPLRNQIVGQEVYFDLAVPWTPFPAFAKDDNPDEFDIEKIRAKFNSSGLARTAFAKSKVVGYNNQEQDIHMYVLIESVSSCEVSHPDINFVQNHARFDPYVNPDNTGQIVLPKDILITYKDSANKDVSHQFTTSDNISYEIQNTQTGEYEPIEAITYNRFGHTLDPKYGQPSATLLFRIILPDGNSSTSISIECLNRVIRNVKFLNKKTLENTASNLIEGTYFVDPYDKETFALPEYAYFSFGQDIYIEADVQRKIELNKYEESPFVLDENGRYVYEPTNLSHKGGQYLFYGYLRGFGQGDARQFFFMSVFVLNRELMTNPTYLNSTYRLEEHNKNPIEFIASDIPNRLDVQGAAFASLENVNFGLESDLLQLKTTLEEDVQNLGATFNYVDAYPNGIYSSFMGISSPVLPEIKWFLEDAGNTREITDSDIVPTGFYLTLDGHIGYGVDNLYVKSQKVLLDIQARPWVFDYIQDIDVGEQDPKIDFSPFTKRPLNETFMVFFKYTSYDNPEVDVTTSIMFVSETEIESYPGARAVMYWGEIGSSDEEGSTKHSLILRNPAKSATGANDIRSPERYSYSFQQVPINEISFGFGPDGGYGETSEVSYIVDPLNIIIPSIVLARGRGTGAGSPLIDIGEVGITWEPGFWAPSNIPMTGGTKTANVELRKTPDSEDFVPFSVNVYFINRRPHEIATNDKPNSYGMGGVSGGYTNLMQVDASNRQLWSFRINPTQSNVFTSSGTDTRINAKYYDVFTSDGGAGELKNSFYLLPTKLRVRYAALPAGFIKSYGLPFYGEVLELIDVKWLISRDIPLEGASESQYISASIRSFRIKYNQVINGISKTVTSAVLSFGYAKDDSSTILKSFYTLHLQVQDKSVAYTNISEQITIPGIATGVVYKAQKAFEDYALDPYNVSFPSTVQVFFEDGDQTTYDNLVWDYNERYISRPDVISGQVSEEHMFLYASFKIYGASLQIRFKIRPRNIDVTYEVGGETTIRPLNGGMIYVVKGKPLVEQLPKFLYYNFEIGGGTTEIARVPLVFEQNAINAVNVNVSKDYGPILANFGKVDKNNIQFIIRVFEPKLTEINQTIGSNAYVMSNYIYDEIYVPVTRRGEYTPSAEVEKLPDKLMLTYDIYGGPYADIKSIEYFFPGNEDPYALIRASYIFKQEDTDVRLFGSSSELSDDKDRQMFSLRVPVKTYTYNIAEASEARFVQNYYEVALGAKINASDLPNVIVGINREIKPLWVLKNVNTNRAGTYTSNCYFKNAYGDIVEGSLDIIVRKYRLQYDKDDPAGKRDFFIESSFLNRPYSGDEVNIHEHIISLPMLREDGSYQVLEKYTVEYSIDNGASWQVQQPLDASPTDMRYLVRISVTDIDDYNITGSISFVLRIEPLNIFGSNIRFEQNGVEVTDMATYTYDGGIKVPDIAGVHRNVQYIREYRSLTSGAEGGFSTSLRPIDVGLYELRLRFAPGQSNFIIEEAAAKLIKIKIEKPVVEYKVLANVTYNGKYMHVPVEGLPQNLTGINVTYIYYQERDGAYQQLPLGSKIINVGKYKVTVRIDGGINYPSDNLDGMTPNSALTYVDFEILKKQIVIKINTVRSEYLTEIKPFDSSVTVESFDGTEIIAGLEALNILKENRNYIEDGENRIHYKILSEGGQLTYRHLVGEYLLSFDSTIEFNFQNYEVRNVASGRYLIEAEKAIIIENKSQLDANISTLRDGHTVRWYLRAGNYGNITLDKNASVSIIGCYDPLIEEEKIIVSFTQIVVNKGSLNLNIVKFVRLNNNANLLVHGASSITITNSYFVTIEDQPGQVPNRVPNTKAIELTSQFNNTIFISNTIVKNYEKAISVNGGSIEMRDSKLINNGIGCEITTQNRYVYFENTRFNGNETGLKFVTLKSNTSLQNNIFNGNKTAIDRGQVILRADTLYQNTFTSNANNIKPEV